MQFYKRGFKDMALSFSYPDLSSHPDFDNHETVLLAQDPDIKFKAYLILHNTQLGPARGGCRYWTRYENEQAAQRDALRLSRGMTFKNTMAGLNYGGAKTVIMGDPSLPKPTREIMHALGHALNELDGAYETGEDVGTSPEDFQIAREVTEHVRVRSMEQEAREDLAGGDPSPYTAFGIYKGILAAVQHKLKTDRLKDVRIAVKGLGHVSQPLCERLHEDGAILYVTDLDNNKIKYCEDRFGAKSVAPDEIIFQEAEIYSPCAMGGDINDETVGRLHAKIIAGGANNQLATRAHAQALHEQGILYAPDYTINAGGVINVVLTGQPKDEVMHRVSLIGRTLQNIFERSQKENKNTAAVADEIVYERLREDLEQRKAVAQ